MADKKDKNSHTIGNELPSVTDILRSSGDANKSDFDFHNKVIRQSTSEPPDNLDELLKKGHNKQGQVSKTKRTTDIRPLKLLDIEAIVNASPQRKALPKNTPIPSHKPERSLHQIISSSRPENVVPQKNQTLDNGVGQYKKRKVLNFVLLGLLAVTIVGLFMRDQTQQQLPDSDVAQQLMVIVNGIERYRLENNRTPDKLSYLPEFPENAVEWAVDQYDIQLEATTLELFFWEDARGYIVMSRYDNEAWMYMEKGEPKIRRVPAR